MGNISMLSKVDFFIFFLLCFCFFNFLLYQDGLHHSFQAAKKFKKLVQPRARAATHSKSHLGKELSQQAEHDFFSPRMKHIQPRALRVPEHKTQLHYNDIRG